MPVAAMTIGQNPSICDNLTYCFTAAGVERLGDQNLDASEDIEVMLLTRDEARALLERDEMKQALMAAPLWRHCAMVRE